MTRFLTWSCLGLLIVPALPDSTEAQRLGGIGRVVNRAAEDEAASQIDRLVRGKVRCVFDDPACIREAEASGKGAVLTDDDGAILVDDEGKPITDPAKVPAAVAQGGAVARPGEGAWANYDFVPGDEVLLLEDYSHDRVGDFPRRYNLVQGNWEVVEWQGDRYLRATANGTIEIPLPGQLPERFTVEFNASVQHGNAYVRLSTAPAYHGDRSYAGSLPSFGYAQAGLQAHKGQGPTSMTRRRDGAIGNTMVAVRIMSDGEYMKMYLNEQRVVNAPNAVFPRTDGLFLSVSSASEAQPILIGAMRIAAGGRDLYDRLARDGRVATQGILFATNSARIRPESTPTLEEIARMLTDHPELRLGIEGHTDSEGETADNQVLSEQRAAAVRTYLVETHRVNATRLQAVGHGESRPAADNGTPEGRQQNRRVELIRLDP
jgi:outer membrane protein OmpA-like peptidoglycan-associated protein